ncbi:MAG TPA: hypothetical protein VEK15_29590, partial [Vicinamibacteria bacterium]|nr:hypothetical protein [Vicinamibacteria bacterium]
KVPDRLLEVLLTARGIKLQTAGVSGSSDSEQPLRDRIIEEIQDLREEARRKADRGPELPPYDTNSVPRRALPPLESHEVLTSPHSPDREELNEIWDVSRALAEPPVGLWARLFFPFRGAMHRLARLALGPLIERQVRMNSLQVRFDNELVSYVDERIDRISRHYDRILGLHGKRMEEIDERHLILQQELIRHVHDLVERIEFVFESAEQNHLYLEGMLRETKEELKKLVDRWNRLSTRNP